MELTIMEMNEFKKRVEELVKERLDSYEVTTKPVQKNNGIVLTGLIINNGLTNISPTIYLDSYLDKFNNGELDIEECVDTIVQQYEKFKMEDNFDVSVFTDYSKCKENICYKLINYRENEKLLEDIPYVVYLDMAIVFYCLLNSSEVETSSILIRNNHMKSWGVNVDDLYEVAKRNTPRLLKSQVMNLSDVLRDMVDDEIGEALFGDVSEEPMIIITNSMKLHGACVMLYKNVLEDVANKLGSDLWIIPSSVHEILVVPRNISDDNAYLTSLVQQVNMDELQPDEVLSDHVYYYSREKKAVSY